MEIFVTHNKLLIILTTILAKLITKNCAPAKG